ncbi:MAG: hypothetical protein AB7O52_02630 [Planctomycetota bacterium]
MVSRAPGYLGPRIAFDAEPDWPATVVWVDMDDDGNPDMRKHPGVDPHGGPTVWFTSDAHLVEFVRFTGQGVPVGIPAGDVDSSTTRDSTDLDLIGDMIGEDYSVVADYDLDGDVDLDDFVAFDNLAPTESLGYGVLSGCGNVYGPGGRVYEPWLPGYWVDVRLFSTYLNASVSSPEPFLSVGDALNRLSDWFTIMNAILDCLVKPDPEACMEGVLDLFFGKGGALKDTPLEKLKESAEALVNKVKAALKPATGPGKTPLEAIDDLIEADLGDVATKKLQDVKGRLNARAARKAAEAAQKAVDNAIADHVIAAAAF